MFNIGKSSLISVRDGDRGQEEGPHRSPWTKDTQEDLEKTPWVLVDTTLVGVVDGERDDGRRMKGGNL